MVYTFGLVKHANIRYRDSLWRLSRCELLALLHALSIECDVRPEKIGGAEFLTFECRTLSDEELSFLSSHSSVAFFSEKNGDLLSPLPVRRMDYLEEDLPEILKYKGKTSSSFTRLMMNIALSLTPFPFSPAKMTLLDPLCGKGTACFCAVQAGMNAIGMDIDRKAVREASDYFSRYLKLHLLKHSVRSYSETSGKASIPVTEYVFSDTRENYRQNDTRFLRFSTGDTASVPAVCRRNPADLLIADLPYGVQHAPQFGTKPESFLALLRRALPEWKKALAPGGVAAVSFNTLTLPPLKIMDLAVMSGYVICDYDFCTHLRHEVEQAVVRDVVFLVNPTKGGN